ncbi:hypothetical protein [Kutzneria chonburiensis]|uniref:Uncharacterized protein n=1 Tax=Kutzneria chonburiensis TaxID=1483604 RepID=A0ABV6MKG8_9PSEU|nr:hypothetical protein [Kutzneria chonburiensis]
MFKQLCAAVVAGAVLAAVGFTVADAAPADNHTNAEQISQLKARLDTAAGNRDSAAVRSAADDLAPVLAAVHQDLDRGVAPRSAADPLAAAEQQNAELRTALTQKDDIFDSIKQMVQKLIEQIKQLLQQLLGGNTPPTKPTKPTSPTEPTSPTAPVGAPGGAPAPPAPAAPIG